MRAKTNVKYAGLVLGVILTLTTNGAFATTPWQIGGEHSTSGVVEVFTYVNAPPIPNTGSTTTLYWLGADTTSTGGNALTQPGLLAVTGSNQWRGQFEIASYSSPGTDLEFFFTNVYFSSGASIALDDSVYPSGDSRAGKNFQFIGDNNNVNNWASMSLHKYTYGNSFYNAYAVFESYDYTGSHFSPMNSHSISFTNYVYYTTPGGVGTSQPLTAFRYPSSPSPPSCITSTGGTGSTTISVSGC